ncbi:MAG: energy transducer TonB [Bacteroidia bacterium]|nr:energy transducer TonB [Bacteroidia bacterium]NNF29826.1 TonB family protein [Flavobacteriaceae bacterium]MBT8275974.1 energy transducer TonB [Bacteroidia bacterium]NNJ82980.1 TonB family protein [Flavobacteriaceae bacterium]NNK53814.1 TonB family protein [Flavobacteriaceae bacterium]
MKNILLLFCLLVSAGSFAQEWGSIDKNKLTMREVAPIWPGCESESSAERDNCFNNKLATHIAKNFKYPAAEYKNNIQGRVVVTFVVNEKGLIDIKSVTGGNKGLQEEAKRNIMSIPEMAKPGMLAGKPRAIEYTVPITFKTGK